MNDESFELLRAAFDAAVAAADPARVIGAALPNPSQIHARRRTLVVGAGKAAASMAAAVEAQWPEEAPLEGLVVTRYAHGLPCRRIRVVEAGHPVPDEAGEDAAAEILARASSLQAEDLLLVLISGGGSSLLALPVESVPIGELKQVTRDLLASGAPIEQMNVLRKHLSRIQGGRLAQSTRAMVLCLVISDVVGDDLSTIASGPCSPDPSTYADALAILQRWRVQAPPSVQAYLEAGARGEHPETPKPGSRAFDRVRVELIATAHASLEAGAAVFERAGVRAAILGDTVTGEAREVAKVMAALTREVASFDAPFARPVALISGGECTVTVRGNGRGGRCAEFLLALAIELQGRAGVWAIAADTDGIDGIEDNAGARLAPDSLQRAVLAGLDAQALLDVNDAWRFFSVLDDLIVTGPTRTNVNDFRAILVRPV